MKKILFLSLLVFFIGCISLCNIAVAEPVPKPSFDCSKATTEVERLTCSDEELAMLDVALNKYYKELQNFIDKNYDKKRSKELKEKLKQKQLAWIKRAYKTCLNMRTQSDKIKCLGGWYAQKITELSLKDINFIEKEKVPTYKTKDEIKELVSSNKELTELKKQIKEAYNRFDKVLSEGRNAKYNQEKLKKKQAEWERYNGSVICMKTDDKVKLTGCLKHVYEYRLQRLTNWADKKDWSFYIKDEYLKDDYETIVSKNGEVLKYFVHYHTFFPELPEEDVEHYVGHVGTDHNTFKCQIYEHTEDVIKSWCGDFRSTAKSLDKELHFNKKSIYYRGAKVLIIPKIPLVEAQKKNITDFLENHEKYELYYRSENRPECMDIKNELVEAIKNNDYKPMYPDATGNSLEELLSQVDLGCYSEDMLMFEGENIVGAFSEYYLSPPYAAYKQKGGFYLLGLGSYVKDDNPMINVPLPVTAKLLYISNDTCKSQSSTKDSLYSIKMVSSREQKILGYHKLWLNIKNFSSEYDVKDECYFANKDRNKK